MMNIRLPGTRYVVLFGGVFAVGSAALMARAALDRGVGPISLSAWRLTIASLILVAAGYRRGALSAAPRLPRSTLARLILAGICLGLHFAAWFASLRLIPVARSTLLVTTA